MSIKIIISLLGLSLLLAGCGVNKEYVSQQISDSEARTSADINAVRDMTDGNAAEIARLQSLSTELSQKTEMAINQAKGFENYQIIWEADIPFDFDGFEINGTAEQYLIEGGEKMEQVQRSVVEFIGHTDRTGSAKYNLMLGDKRAESCRRFLAQRFGISLYRMFTLSYGETKPIAMQDESQAASTNRRVKVRVWGEL